MLCLFFCLVADIRQVSENNIEQQLVGVQHEVVPGQSTQSTVNKEFMNVQVDALSFQDFLKEFRGNQIKIIHVYM